jgi:hypothetical protein
MSAVALTGPLPLVARFVGALLLVNCPSQPLAKSNERSPVSQLERNLASLSVDSGVGIGFARSLDDPYATHLAQSHQRTAQTGRWFPRSTGDARALTGLGPQGAFNLSQIGRVVASSCGTPWLCPQARARFDTRGHHHRGLARSAVRARRETLATPYL